MLKNQLVPAAMSALTIMVLTACSSDLGTPHATSAPTDTTAPEPTTEAASLSLDKQETVKFSGTSTKNTKSFTVGSPLKIEYSHSGSGNFIAMLTGSEGDQFASIANVIGKKKATTWVYGASGKAHFEIIADGKWTITATTVVPKISTLPAAFKASVGVTTQPFRADGDITVKWTHKGEGNFIVTLVDPTDGGSLDVVANVIGNSSDETVLYGVDGLAAFDVLADGPWTLSVTSS